ncbi:MAG: TolC family protein [Acidobacteria bacterium]|nr:TolC family protein [Acidobacteriota bacterium]
MRDGSRKSRFWLAAAALALSGAAHADEPLTLREAMARARENAGEVVAAGARAEAAEARVRQARGFRLPAVNVSEIYTRTNSAAEAFALKLNKGAFSFPDFVANDPNDPAWLGAAITRVEATFPVFTGGELSARIAQARSAAEAAGKTAGFAADTAALNAAEAYVKVAQAEEYVRLLTASRSTVSAHVELARAYAGEGMLVRSEVLRAEVELARIEDLLSEAEGNVRLASANLAFRLGEGGASRYELAALPPPAPIDGEVSAWLASAADRADLQAARSLLRAGELEARVKGAAFLPKAGLMARYDLVGTRLFGNDSRAGTLMAVLQWNVFAGFSDKAAVAAAKADARAGRADLERFGEGVRLEARQAFEEARTARERHATSLKALEAAREGERIVNERFRSGVVKMLDVLDAATARREAETRELVARAEAQLTGFHLASKAGRRPETLLEER